MSSEPVNQPILPTPNKRYSEKTKLKAEVVLSILSTFAIVIVAAMAFRYISNDAVKMITRPVVYVLLLGIPLFLSKLIKNPIHTLGFNRNELLKQVLTGLGVFMAIELVFTIAVFSLGESKGVLLPLKETRIGIIIYSIFSAMICAGMGEEILFRGYYMERVRALTDSDTWAIAIPALMFGLWHFPSGQDFLQVIITALLGATFGFARVRIRNSSTLSVGIAHGLHDVYILILSCILL